MLEEKLEALKNEYRNGRTGRLAFYRAGFQSVSEFQMVATPELLQELNDLYTASKEEDMELATDENRSDDIQPFYNKAKDKFQRIDLSDDKAVLRAIKQNVYMETLKHPDNPALHKSTLEFAKLNLSGGSKSISQSQNGAYSLSYEQIDPAKEEEIIQYYGKLDEEAALTKFQINYVNFCVNAGYNFPYIPQLKMVDFLNQPGINMLLSARSYGKTKYAVVNRVAYRLKYIPGYTCIIITAEQSRGKDLIRDIRDAAEKNGVQFSIKNATKLITSNVDNSNRTVSLGTISSLRSWRGQHVDELIFDDPCTSESFRVSDREQVFRAYNEATNIAKIINIIGQPVHRQDLYCTLRRLKAGEAQAEGEEELKNIDSLKILQMKWGTIPQLDADLDAKRKAGVTEDEIQRNYYLEVNEESSMPFTNVEYCNDFGNGRDLDMWIDPSFTGGDYTAICLGYVQFDKYKIKGWLFKKAWYDLLQQIVDIANDNRVTRVIIENNNLGESPNILFRQYGLKVIGHATEVNKEKKIMSMAVFNESLQLYNGPTIYQEENILFNRDFKSWEMKSKHDDSVDSAASLMLYQGKISCKAERKN